MQGGNAASVPVSGAEPSDGADSLGNTVSLEIPGSPASISGLTPPSPPGSRPRSATRHAWIWITACAIGIPVLVLIGLALIERIAARGEIVGGVEIAGVDASGRSEELARIRVAHIARRLESEPVRVRIGRTEEVIAPATVGLRVDVDETVRRARAAGRGDNPVAVLAGTVLRQFRPDDVPLAVTVDEGRLEAVLAAWSRATAIDLRDGSVRIEGLQVIEIAPRAGIGLRGRRARTQLLHSWGAGRSGPTRLSYGPVRPNVGRAAVRKAAEEVRELLRLPHAIVVGPSTVTLAPARLAPTITVTTSNRRLVVGVDPGRLHAALAPDLVGVERAPVDATWSVDGTVATVVPSVPGAVLDIRPVAAGIRAGKLRVVGTLDALPPVHDTAWAEALHITELVSTFTTTHNCCEARVTNIHLAADTIDNMVVLPGQTFSLNETLGPRTVEKGYLAAPAIGEDLGLVEDVGGGVSQVSTTLFNATYFGGYEDVTHEVHAIYISRYPKGREATLNYPSIDNRFRNDSDAGVLIKSSYTDTSLTISFYGSKNGRTVSSDGPNTLETIEPPIEYTDDLSLPAGTEKVTTSGSPGYVVENIRIISREGQPDVRQRFIARYQPVPTQISRNPTPAPPPVDPALPIPPAAPAVPTG
jgi:vancomycin resistance protein YoaR